MLAVIIKCIPIPRRRNDILFYKLIDGKIGGGKAHTLTFQNVPGDKNASFAHLETGTDKNEKTRNTLCMCFPTVFVDLK